MCYGERRRQRGSSASGGDINLHVAAFKESTFSGVASMELITWLLASLAYLVGLIWSLIWFLISGWVSTLLQIAVLVAVIYWLKYGWQRAPYEIWRRTRSFGRFFWSWIRGRDPEPRAHEEVVRLVRRREFGDVNVSTLLSLAALVGLLLMAPLR